MRFFRVLFVCVATVLACASSLAFALDYESGNYRVTVKDDCVDAVADKVCEDVSVLMMHKKSGDFSVLRAKKIFEVKKSDEAHSSLTNTAATADKKGYIYKFEDSLSGEVYYITHDARFMIFLNKKLQYIEKGRWQGG